MGNRIREMAGFIGRSAFICGTLWGVSLILGAPALSGTAQLVLLCLVAGTAAGVWQYVLGATW